MNSIALDWNAIPAKPTRMGEVRQFFQMRTTLLDELECHVTTLNPGMSPHPPHQHREEEMIIVKEGELEAQLASEMVRVGPGSMLFLASNELHGWTNVGSVPATYYVIRIRTAE